MKIVLGIIASLGVVLFLAMFMALPTMWLWNWLMPDIFDVIEITFWQAFGLNFLSGILFKSNNSSSD